MTETTPTPASTPSTAPATPPRSVRLSLTDRCDLACIYCRPNRQDGYLERRLDLPGLDAKAADLELLVAATQKQQNAVGAPERAISRAIQTLSWRPKRIGYEALGSQFRSPDVAARKASTAQE